MKNPVKVVSKILHKCPMVGMRGNTCFVQKFLAGLFE